MSHPVRCCIAKILDFAVQSREFCTATFVAFPPPDLPILNLVGGILKAVDGTPHSSSRLLSALPARLDVVREAATSGWSGREIIEVPGGDGGRRLRG